MFVEARFMCIGHVARILNLKEKCLESLVQWKRSKEIVRPGTDQEGPEEE